MRSAISHLCVAVFSLAFLATGVCGQQTKLSLPKLALQTGHWGSVAAAAFSPGSKTIATAGDDWNAKLWKADTGEVVRTLIGHTGSLTAIAFSPNQRFLGTAGLDAVIRPS